MRLCGTDPFPIASDAYGRINTNTAAVSLSTNSTFDNWAKAWFDAFPPFPNVNTL
jgi:hypothetical protein